MLSRKHENTKTLGTYHTDTRALLRGLLQPEFDVIADVADGTALVSAAEQLSPDVIVTDISMSGLDGLKAATEILRRNPAARIVFVTVHGDTILVERCLAKGALGFVLKLAAADELVPAVHAARRGERQVSSSCLLLDKTLPERQEHPTADRRFV